MKKLLLLFYFTCCILHFSLAQNPLVKQWDYRFGGTGLDRVYSLQQTVDGGLILGGSSASGIGGDKTQPIVDTCTNCNFQGDYWIVKVDSLGIYQWDKDFGADTTDELTSLQQTADGGYILGGYSYSGIAGDKTQANWDTICIFGCKPDYWIIKIDSLGIKQWDKRFGGTSFDKLFSVQQTPDGGYILGGSSQSGISGDKTQPLWGVADYWIIKIDSLGIKQWDKDFGGTNVNELYSLQQTTDGGYILGGYSSSNIGGDKTQNTWGYADYWIVKIDSVGNKQWDKDFGGTGNDWLYSLRQTSDGGYILGGLSYSGISGDKTQANWDPSGNSPDYWIVKTDSLGNKQWDKDFGGTLHEDEFGNVFQTADGGYLVSGTSYSPISGDKTEDNLAPEQTWIVKTDSLGNKEWDKTFHTNAGDDEIGLSIQTKDGCYAITNFTGGGIGGDKTQPCWGGYDYWIIKLCDTTSTTSINQISNFQFPISVSPNPFTDEITITLQKQNIYKASFTIKNVLGQTVFEKTKSQTPTTNFQTTLNLDFLSKGIYLLEATINGERIVKKIVKQ